MFFVLSGFAERFDGIVNQRVHVNRFDVALAMFRAQHLDRANRQSKVKPIELSS